jgi:hypothetical protein
MENFELLVRPHGFELHGPNPSDENRFPTLLNAFAHAQLIMSGERGEMLIRHDGDRFPPEHVPLYRLTY